MGFTRHLVLFRLHPTVTDEQVSAALDLLRAIAAVEGVAQWRVELSTDTRKGIVIVENGLLDDAFIDHFRRSAEHIRAGELMKEIADIWLVGDYAEGG
jgi:hypothetical protein